MANVVVVLDADAERRAGYVAAVRASIALVPGLVVAGCEGTDWAAVWAAAPTAPVSWEADARGGAVVWGEAIDEAGQRQTAAGVRAAWHADGTVTWDGFHAAMVVDDAGQLTVGADVLGIFPVYYWQGPGVVLVGTSPELFSGHPAFKAQLDVAGLVGVLLTNGLVGGATLWKGVRRLAPGHQLRVRDGRVRELETYRVPEAMEAASLPFSGHVELLAEAIGSAVRRHAPIGHRYGLLLSGGLDSRMLAGFLAAQGTRAHALTFGRHDDVELACAKGVTSALGLDHDTAEIPAAAYPPAAEVLARWESLAAGFGGVPEWGMHPQLACLPPRVVMGHMLDGVAGGIHVSWDYDPVTRSYGFDKMLEWVTRWGFTPGALRELLVPSVHDVIGEVTTRFRAAYESYSKKPHLRAWLGDLYHRQRFHVASSLWVTSFSSWPVVPALDRRLLAVASSMPASSLADRRVQEGVLTSRFRELAALPLDRNSYDSFPLQPRLRHHVARYVRDHWKRATRAILPDNTSRERRYYYRLYDLNSPGWRAVRELAELHRSSLPQIFRRETVAAWLPTPSQSVSLANPIVQSSALKMLLGLALVGRAHRFD